MVLGIILLAVGSGVYSYADFGRGSYEALIFALESRNHWQTRYVRMVLDIACVTIGLFLGGTIGACTVVTILISGIVLQQVVDTLKNRVHADMR